MDDKLKQGLINLNTDYNKALERFVGNEDLYHKFLFQFLNDYNFYGLKESLRYKDITSAFQYAHTLRGVTGNLGLTPLYETTQPLVELLRNRQLAGTEVLMETLERDYQALCNLLRTFITDLS